MKDKLGFTNYRRNDYWYGCKLSRKNFDEAAKFIDRCNGGTVIVDKKAGIIRFTTWGLTGDRTAAIAHLGDYLVRNGGDVKVYQPGSFRSQFNEIISYRELLWYTPTETEVNVLKALQYDSEMCYPYRWIEDYTKVDRAETKKAVDHLRELGVVSFIRGLMTEDGEVAGAGFGINEVQQQLLAELLILRYETRNNAE